MGSEPRGSPSSSSLLLLRGLTLPRRGLVRASLDGERERPGLRSARRASLSGQRVLASRLQRERGPDREHNGVGGGLEAHLRRPGKPASVHQAHLDARRVAFVRGGVGPDQTFRRFWKRPSCVTGRGTRFGWELRAIDGDGSAARGHWGAAIGTVRGESADDGAHLGPPNGRLRRRLGSRSLGGWSAIGGR